MPTITVTVPSSQTRVVALSRGKHMKNLASGRKISTVLAKAKKADSSKEPIVFFVPKKNAVHIL